MVDAATVLFHTPEVYPPFVGSHTVALLLSKACQAVVLNEDDVVYVVPFTTKVLLVIAMGGYMSLDSDIELVAVNALPVNEPLISQRPSPVILINSLLFDQVTLKD